MMASQAKAATARGTAARMASAALLLVILSNCNLSRTILSEDDARDAQAPGSARKIEAKGILLRLGSDDPQATPEERPGWTRFSHDYWMDTTELTQEEFVALTGRNPSKVSGSRLPVTDVTWYDAVLAANARSRRDGLDTVYAYAGSRIGTGGEVLDLSGLSVHLERDGWRLPTEAEWEFASRAGIATPYPWGTLADSSKARSHAWYQANSGGATHDVGTLAPNAWGLHDMAGNVMEWVQDWKGPFPRDTIADYAGPEAPRDIPEIPLKGGAAPYGIERLRPSSRTGSYAAYPSSKAEYVGFRLVRGAFAARTSNASGATVEAPSVSILPANLSKVLGATQARLVFVHRFAGKGILRWIDFAETSPIVRSLPDPDPAFHPAISPDGKWVVWSTAMEGSSSTASRIKARRLTSKDSPTLDLGAGAIPRWWVDGADTFLVWVRSAQDNTDPAWSANRTFARRWTSFGLLMGAVSEWGAGAFHDGRSGPYLYTGYRRLKQLDVRSGRQRTLFAAPANGKSPGDTSQVCNVSAAPDPSGRVMFLDFGYAARSSLVGRPYGIHEIAFVADSLGNVLQSIPAPPGKSQWDHLEWSNHPRWAVAVAVEPSGTHKEIHLLDLVSETSVPLLSAEELWMPNLWVGPTGANLSLEDSELDSAGAWTIPKNTYELEEFAIKTRAFWMRKDSVEIAFIGSSRAKAGFDPTLIRSGSAFNWAYSAAEIQGNRKVVEQYLLPHASRLRVVLLSLMPGWMFSYRSKSWTDIEAGFGYRYDANHRFWREGVPRSYLEVVGARSWPTSSLFDSLGGTYHDQNDPVASPPPWLIPAGTSEDFAKEPFVSNWTDLVATIDTLNRRGIQVVLVNFPQNKGYKDTPYAGIYGPTWATWKELTKRIRTLEAGRPLFHFYDANRDGLHDYPSWEFINADHLNSLGAIRLTSRLDSILHSISSQGR
ncbi:MAG TPA: TIGR02171 family protein [Fibrobacteria bacterium]|mgnify:FL=1|nr:TIGR02171 family protein [Fibrobacteria bacterium]